MTSRQYPSAATIQSRLLYEQARYYQPIDHQLNLSYSQYATVSNRTYNNISLPYASNAYGVYRRIPPHIKSPPSLHPNLNRRIDLRNRSQQRQLSRSIDNNNNKNDDNYQKFNGLINTIHSNPKQSRDEKNSSNIFNYTFHQSRVSLIII